MSGTSTDGTRLPHPTRTHARTSRFRRSEGMLVRIFGTKPHVRRALSEGGAADRFRGKQ
jgi:hypothetical protein